MIFKKFKKTDSNLPLTRRDLLELLGFGAALPFVGSISPIIPSLLVSEDANAQAGGPHRILQIFLEGGWDAQFTTDPVAAGSAKALSGNFQSDYYDGTIANSSTQVPGKSNLSVGPGLFNATSSFASMPTAFVNGIFVEVTAHELAVNYMLSGQLSLSRSREYPAFVATVADQIGGFPAHVVLGGNIPLGDTKQTNPPLQSLDVGQFSGMLAGPRAPGFFTLTDESIAAADTLIGALNTSVTSGLAGNAVMSLEAWKKAEGGLGSLYAKRYDTKIAMTSQIKTDYGIANDQYSTMQAKLAGAFMVLREGLTPYVTASFGGFDTHLNHTASHLPLLQSFSTTLNQLISDLKSTNDPDDPTQKLSDTTTVIITSEFVRTPKFNLSAGTDHWQSGCMILMGKGITDNVSIGATDIAGNAMGWTVGSGVSLNAANALLPDHLAASIIRKMGFVTEADEISSVNLSDIFGV